MSGLFFDYYALKFNDFNADLSNWDTSNVTNMNYMFYRAEGFNNDISRWNVSKVTDMAGMFSSSLAFNQNLQSWDVSNVQDMYQMFMNAASFNQNLSNWEIGNVKDMTQMFERTSMDQSLCWDLKDVLDTTGMFENTKIRMECLPTPSVTPSQELTSNPSVSIPDKPFKIPSNEPSTGSSASPGSETKSSAGTRQIANGLNLVICLLLSFLLSLCLLRD